LETNFRVQPCNGIRQRFLCTAAQCRATTCRNLRSEFAEQVNAFIIIPPNTHPHVVTLHIDPVQYQQLERLSDERPEVRLLHCDSSEPDCWTVRTGCASAAIAERLEDGWG